MQQMEAPAPEGEMPMGNEGLSGQGMLAQTQQMMDIPTGSGNGALQRAIMQSGDTKGLVRND